MSHTVIGNQGSSPGSPLLRSTKSILGVVTQADLEALVRTLRRLLAAVTRILLLADNVVVKQLLVASSVSGSSNFIRWHVMTHDNSLSGTIEKKAKKTGSSPTVTNNGGGPTNSVKAVASISTMHHFNEFVKAFCDFGSDMVHLIRITAGTSITSKDLAFLGLFLLSQVAKKSKTFSNQQKMRRCSRALKEASIALDLIRGKGRKLLLEIFC